MSATLFPSSPLAASMPDSVERRAALYKIRTDALEPLTVMAKAAVGQDAPKAQLGNEVMKLCRSLWKALPQATRSGYEQNEPLPKEDLLALVAEHLGPQAAGGPVEGVQAGEGQAAGVQPAGGPAGEGHRPGGVDLRKCVKALAAVHRAEWTKQLREKMPSIHHRELDGLVLKEARQMVRNMSVAEQWDVLDQHVARKPSKTKLGIWQPRLSPSSSPQPATPTATPTASQASSRADPPAEAHVTSGPWGDRGVTNRPRARCPRRRFGLLKKRSGHTRRVRMDLRKALEFAAGNTVACSSCVFLSAHQSSRLVMQTCHARPVVFVSTPVKPTCPCSSCVSGQHTSQADLSCRPVMQLCHTVSLSCSGRASNCPANPCTTLQILAHP